MKPELALRLGVSLARFLGMSRGTTMIPAFAIRYVCSMPIGSHVKAEEATRPVSRAIVEFLEYFADIARKPNRDRYAAAEVCRVPIQLRQSEDFRAHGLD